MAVINNRGTQSFYSEEFEDYEEIKSMINKESIGLTSVPSKDTELSIDEDADLLNQEDGFGLYEENLSSNLDLAIMLEKASNHMDRLGLYKEADFLTYLIKVSLDACPSGNCHTGINEYNYPKFTIDTNSELELFSSISLPKFLFDPYVKENFPITSSIRSMNGPRLLLEINKMMKGDEIKSFNIDEELQNYINKDSELRKDIRANSFSDEKAGITTSNQSNLYSIIDGLGELIALEVVQFRKSYEKSEIKTLISSYNSIKKTINSVSIGESEVAIDFKPYINSIENILSSLKPYVVRASIYDSIQNASFEEIFINPSYGSKLKDDFSKTKINIDKGYGHTGHGIGKEVAERFIELRPSNKIDGDTWHYIEKNPHFLELFNVETLVVDLAEGVTDDLMNTYLYQFEKEINSYSKKINKYSEECESFSSQDCKDLLYLANSKLILHLGNNFNFGKSKLYPFTAEWNRGSLDDQVQDFAFEDSPNLLEWSGLSEYDNKFPGIEKETYLSKAQILQYIIDIKNVSNRDSLSYILINDFEKIPIYKSGSFTKNVSTKNKTSEEVSDLIYRYAIRSLK